VPAHCCPVQRHEMVGIYERVLVVALIFAPVNALCTTGASFLSGRRVASCSRNTGRAPAVALIISDRKQSPRRNDLAVEELRSAMPVFTSRRSRPHLLDEKGSLQAAAAAEAKMSRKRNAPAQTDDVATDVIASVCAFGVSAFGTIAGELDGGNTEEEVERTVDAAKSTVAMGVGAITAVNLLTAVAKAAVIGLTVGPTLKLVGLVGGAMAIVEDDEEKEAGRAGIIDATRPLTRTERHLEEARASPSGSKYEGLESGLQLFPENAGALLRGSVLGALISTFALPFIATQPAAFGRAVPRTVLAAGGAFWGALITASLGRLRRSTAAAAA
jgi:hypothetical protein